MKKYAIDAVLVAICLGAALFSAERPKMVLEPQPIAAVNDEGEDADKTLLEAPRSDDGNHEALRLRNIFAADGLYSSPDATGAQARPYRLLGIIHHGPKRKAVFQDPKGAIVPLSEGDKLVDEFVVTRIERLSAEVKNARETKEYSIFNRKRD